MTLASADPLPSWLVFTGDRLIGTPPQNYNGEIGLTLSASDGSSSVSMNFDLTIRPVNDAPSLVTPLADREVAPGAVLDVVLPNNTFIDADGDQLQYLVLQADGAPLPSWLSFDGVRFSGIVPSDFNEILEIEVARPMGAA